MIIEPSNLSLDWNDPVNKSHELNRGLIFWAQVLPNLYGYGSKTWFDLVRKRRGTSSGWDGDEWGGYAPMKGSFGSFRLDGTNDYIYWPNIVPSNITEFTFVAKVNLSSTGSNQGIIALYDSATPSNRSNVALYGSGQTVRYWDNNNGWMSYSGVYTFGTTLHVVITVKSSGENKLYHNGIEVNSRTLVSTAGKNSVAVGASNNSGGEYAKGQLDCLRVYNRLLSAAEVMALYQADMRGSKELFSSIDLFPHTLVLAAGGVSTTLNLYLGSTTSTQITTSRLKDTVSKSGSLKTSNSLKSISYAGSVFSGYLVSTVSTKTPSFNLASKVGNSLVSSKVKASSLGSTQSSGFLVATLGSSGKVIRSVSGARITSTSYKLGSGSSTVKVGTINALNYARSLSVSSNSSLKFGTLNLNSIRKNSLSSSIVSSGTRTYAVNQSTPKFYIGIYKRM